VNLSVTDVQGARLASVQSVGYANKPGKRERLSEAGAGAIINSLADLALKFRARVADPAAPAARQPSGLRPDRPRGIAKVRGERVDLDRDDRQSQGGDGRGRALLRGGFRPRPAVW
jgi:hypothetical protein